MKKTFQILSVLLLVIAAGISAYFYQLAGKSLYYKYGKAHWQVSHPASCSTYRERYYENLQPTDAPQPLDLTCEQARVFPARSHTATTVDGLSIHYRVFHTTLLNPPLLLHVPGITSDWLNGARYVQAAERMGFQLVVMEMRNHGSSAVNGEGVRYGCKEKHDVVAVLEQLHQQYPERPVLVWGSSGATMAVINAGEALQYQAYVKGVILENPISSLGDVARVKSPGLPEMVYQGFLKAASLRGGVDFAACAPIQQASALKQPVLVTVSLQDTLTPEWMAKKVTDSLPRATLKTYPEGAHERIWNGQPVVYEQDLKAFWQQL